MIHHLRGVTRLHTRGPLPGYNVFSSADVSEPDEESVVDAFRVMRELIRREELGALSRDHERSRVSRSVKMIPKLAR